MTATIFTHPPDYAQAALAGRALRSCGVKVVLAIDAADPVPEVEGCRVARTTFRRLGNLNGKACVEGILATIQENADGDPYQMKVDSDTLVMGLGWLEGRIEPAVGMHHRIPPHDRFMFGAAYALRTDLLDDYRAAAAMLPESDHYSEDVEIGKLLPGIHAYENLAADCPFAAYSWKSARTIEDWKRYEILIFQRFQGRNRRDIRETMQLFV
ncbi:hypothetical protein OKA04_15815 [Luteolibacter flavescens]|uniref:Glycosyltransferase n=1 Tax=Luteolibacter flavescens TaxID=1859460 RepID=A0ABT3FRL5_9BACT|nr:hypothetical protein [Luteolibacter flavescens]MCW1886205.1 hypothetical protein [Luteolibacter flavescens]